MSTASVVLNHKDSDVQVTEKTKARVFAAAHELGYVPNAMARGLNTHRSNIVGVVGAAASYAEAERIRGIRSFLEARGYNVRTLPMSSQRAGAAEPLDAYRSMLIDGLILIGEHRLPPGEGLKNLIDEGVPVVTADMDVQHPGVPCVNVASYDGYSATVNHLIEHGYRHIALISGALDQRVTRECRRAYTDALAAAGISYDERYVLAGDWHLSGGYYCMRELLSRDMPIRAVQAGNDMMAMGAIKAIKEHGLRVPEDIAVAGYDDDVPFPAAYLSPALTTGVQPFFRLGNEVAALLYDLLNGRQPVWNSVIPVDLVVRESCGCKLPDSDTCQVFSSPSQARQAARNTSVELVDHVVSAVLGHAFYVQDKAGSSGIKVAWNDIISPRYLVPGLVISLAGRVLISADEAVIGDACIRRMGSTDPPPPAEVDLAHLRARIGLGDMLGVLITTTGTVTSFSSERTRSVTIEMTDGARANVLLMETDYYPGIGDRIAVTGVLAKEYNRMPSILAQAIRCL